MQGRWLLSVFVLSGALSLFYSLNRTSITPETICTIYGDVEVDEPVLLELIHSNAFERLKKINQYGVNAFTYPTKIPYSRYTHSLGVFYLLRAFGASLQEQMAGLLHDVSHTVFSHVGDHVVARLNNQKLDQNDDAYQDSVHVSYLRKTDIAHILKRHNIPIEQMDHKCGDYHMLEKEYPDICADRLEYVLYGGYIEGWLTSDEIHTILSALSYENGKWIFNNIEQAKKLSLISMRLCEEIFANVWNIGSYENATDALLQALNIGLISMDDIHFGHDHEIWHLLRTCDDPLIEKAMEKMAHVKDLYIPSDSSEYDLSYVGKFRGIDPLVKTEKSIARVSELDTFFRSIIEAAQERVVTAHYFKLKENVNEEIAVAATHLVL